MTKKDFADIADVSKAAVSKAIRAGKIPVSDDGTIDVDAAECKAYISARRDKNKRQKSKSKQKPTKLKTSIKRGDVQSDCDIDKIGVATRKLALELQKLSEHTRNMMLKNSQLEGLLVSRDVFEFRIWNPLETFFNRLLNDGVKTIVANLWPMAQSGETRQSGEEVARKELSSHIKKLKMAMTRAKKVCQIDDES